MEPYPSRQFGFIDNPDRQFGNCSVCSRTRTRSDGPEPLLTLIEYVHIQHLLIHHLQVYLAFLWIAAHMCISECMQAEPPCGSPNMLDHSLEYHTLMAWKCISTLTRTGRPGASLSSLDPQLHAHLQIPLFTTINCISKFARIWPPSTSLHSINHFLQVHH